MALSARIHAWRDRRRIRRHVHKDEELIALSHEHLQDDHGERHGADMEKAMYYLYGRGRAFTTRGIERRTDEWFRPPKDQPCEPADPADDLS